MFINNNSPLGLAFIHRGKCYYYDTNKNNILEVGFELYDEIKKRMSGIYSVFSNEYNNMREKGYFAPSPIERIELSDINTIKTQCEHNLMQLILQVTQQCNFLCRYCTYAGDGMVERTHSDKYMQFDIAQRAIDHLYMHSVDNKEVLISFYGGEPLLQFELIKKCIEYAKSIFSVKKCKFSMTTNGSLLTEAIIDYCCSNDVNIALSLDGPIEIQNANRRFVNNGKGTFESVVAGVNLIRNKHPDYYKKCITFHPVINPSSNLSKLVHFFEHELGADEKRIQVSRINTSGLSLTFDSEIIDGRKVDFDRYDFEASKKTSEYFDEMYADKRAVPKKYHHSGPCIPGAKKLFVSTDGKYYPCEKLNERYDNNVIGDVYSGLNYEKIYKVINIGKYTEDKCKNCWCIRFCRTCIADIEGENDMQIIAKINNTCIYQKQQVLDAMKMRIDSNL